MNYRGRHGIGLRAKHYSDLYDHGPRVPWVEAITENFLRRGGRPVEVLERVRRDASLALHGVSLSIGSLDPLDLEYLAGVKELMDRFEPEVVSDHLCFSSFGGHRGHDLWPLPYTEEALEHVTQRVHQVQARLGGRIALENPSRYVAFAEDSLEEWQFLNELTRRTGCGLLLDVNNVFVSAHNLAFDAREYLLGLDLEPVLQLHVAGHSDAGDYLLDDHGSPVSQPVWLLLEGLFARGLDAPVIVEWDGDVPPLPTVIAEAERAAELIHRAERAA